MKHYYKSKWEWFCESPDRCYWRSPGGNSVGVVDLRSDTEAGKSGGVPEGFGVFAYAEPQTIDGAEYLGTDVSVVSDFVWRKLTVDADPTGKDAPKPLVGKIGKKVALYIAGEKVKSEDFNEEHRQRTVAVFQADYRKNVDKYPKGLLQKWVGAKMEEIYGEKSDEKANLLVPAEHRKGKLWKEPATVIGDTFVDTNGVNLESHTATGTGGGFSWSKVTGGQNLEIQSNRIQKDAGGNGDVDYRADSDLSTDDMYAKATVGTTSSSFDCAVEVRFSSSARTHYQSEWGNTFRRISKFVAGAHTILTSDGSSNSAGDVLECRVDGSDIKSYRNGVQVLTTQTDTSITGHLRAGLNSWHEQTTWDDFEAGDLSSSTAYDIVAAVGAFTITGQTANLSHGTNVAADAGSFALTGQDTSLSHGTNIVVGQGSYTLTGQDANLSHATIMALEAGALTLTGNDVSFTSGYVLGCDPGSYALTGNDATFNLGLTMTADSGSFALTGQNAGLSYGVTLNSETGTFVLTGHDAGLSTQYVVLTETGGFILTGQDAALTFSQIMSAEKGTLTLVGNDTALPIAYKINPETGTFTLTGNNVNLGFSSPSGAGNIIIGIAI